MRADGGPLEGIQNETSHARLLFRNGTPTITSSTTASQSSRPTKRPRSAGADDALGSSLVAPRTVPNKRTLPLKNASRDVASSAPMAPMAPIDSPTAASLDSSVAEEITSSIKETVTTTSTPNASIFGLGSKIVSAFTGNKAASPVTPAANNAPKQTARVETPKPGPVAPADGGNDTEVELENQLQEDSVDVASNAQTGQKPTPAPTASSTAGANRNASIGSQTTPNDTKETLKVAEEQKDAKTATVSQSDPKTVRAKTPKATPLAATKPATKTASSPAKTPTPKVDDTPKPSATQPATKPTTKPAAKPAAKPAPRAKAAPQQQRAKSAVTMVVDEAIDEAVQEVAEEVTVEPAEGPAEKTVEELADSYAVNVVDKPDENGEFEIDMLVGHRPNAIDPTLIDVRVSWKTNKPDGEYTWEPESNVQEDAPDVLFKYWRSVKGGRASALKNPGMWHVLRIEDHRVLKVKGDVVLHVAWIGSPKRSWEPEDRVAVYAAAHLDDYWEKLGGREIALCASPVLEATMRGRGRPLKNPAPKAVPAKPAASKTAAAKRTPAAAAVPVATTTKRQKKVADEKEDAAPATSGLATRSSRR